VAVTREQFLAYLAANYYGNCDPEEQVDEAIAFGETLTRRAACSDQNLADILVMEEAARFLDLTAAGTSMRLKKDGAATVHDSNIRRIRDAIGAAKGAF